MPALNLTRCACLYARPKFSFFHFHFSLCFPSLFLPPSPSPFPALNIPFRDPLERSPQNGDLPRGSPKGTSHPRGSHLLLDPAIPSPPGLTLLPLTLGHSEPIVHLFLGSSTHNVFRLCMFHLSETLTLPHEVGNPCCWSRHVHYRFRREFIRPLYRVFQGGCEFARSTSTPLQTRYNRSLQIRYKRVATNSLRPGHYELAPRALHLCTRRDPALQTRYDLGKL